jgi:glycosyltransferase involved in cell wall biosynthesis
MQKQTIVIVINDLGKGGAEVLLVGILPELNKRYNVVLVTLIDTCDFPEDKIVCSHRYILGLTNKLSVISAVIKMRRIIRRHNAALVSVHLVYSGLIARLACPSDVPLVYNVHAIPGISFFNSHPVMRILEKLTTRSYHSVIAVSNEALKDYEQTIKKVKNEFVLANYVGDAFFREKIETKKYSPIEKLQLVAVGNLRDDKNYSYLIEALAQLKQYSITLEVYGKPYGNSLEDLQKEAEINQAAVVFKGKSDNIQDILPQYDLYVMATKHEGFGIAVAEAMAAGLPLLLSDLPILRSVTYNNAIFFDISNPSAFANRIKEIVDGKYDLNMLAHKGVELAKEHYTQKVYTEKLFDIYDKVSERIIEKK